MTTPPVPSAATTPRHRLKSIDGWRAVAALFVVLSHALNYRFATVDGPFLHLARRLSGPLAELGVQLFFVISGFIITSLLIREQAERGRISILAFYVRRLCRIMPPLVTLFLVLLVLAAAGEIVLPVSSVVAAASFTCNIGWVDCSWHVAHTWSLAVEEQFYLGWPLLFATLLPWSRTRTLVAVLALCMIGIAVQPPVFHGNFTSFACIAAGALYASVATVRQAVQRSANLLAWLVVGAVIALAPVVQLDRWTGPLVPVAVTYLIFAGIQLPLVRLLLESKPFQIIGLGSYSLYLWQQLFLGRPDLYAHGSLPLILLPLVVATSVYLVEKPFIRLSHRLSSAALAQRVPATAS